MDADELGDLGQNTTLVSSQVENIDPVKLEPDESFKLVVPDQSQPLGR